MNIDLKELTGAGIIDTSTADAIKIYYESKKQKGTGSRFFQIISVLGILLVALGLMLIIGYNWYHLPKWTKVTLGFLPLLAAQLLGVYTLIRNKMSKVWCEISATSIIAGIAIAMSLLSNIYNLDAAYSDFLKWGLVLCIPVVILFDSGIGSLISWIGLGFFIIDRPLYLSTHKVLIAVGFIAVLLYLYIKHLIENRINLTWAWHHLFIPVVLVIFTFALGPYSCQNFVLLHLLILCFAFSTISDIQLISDRLWIHIYKMAGFGGSFILAFIYSFKNFWTQRSFNLTENCFTYAGIAVTTVFAIVFLVAILYLIRSKSWDIMTLFDIKWMILLLSLLTIVGNQFPDLSSSIVNILLLLSSAFIIKEGINTENLLQLNVGIVILIVWVICRFFGTDIPYLWKGIIFIILGLLCFSLNYILLKRKRS